jgi:ABC-type multidrug transport system permease subunit
LGRFFEFETWVLTNRTEYDKVGTMKRNKLLSALVFMLSIAVGAVVYFFIMTNYEKIWFNFQPLFYLCITTFISGIGIYISAVLIEDEQNN